MASVSAFLTFALCLLPFALTGSSIEVLSPTNALPAHLATQLREPAGYMVLANGDAIIYDRGAQSIYKVDAAKGTMRKIVDVGTSGGELFNPIVFTPGPAGMFATVDLPFGRERVQLFVDTGKIFGGFGFPSTTVKTTTMIDLGIGRVDALQFTGQTILASLPASGSLFTEFDRDGHALRQIGTLRPTGVESRAGLHAALNRGIALADPKGGFYFVFETGLPMFRKYDAAGTLIYERHIEGAELDRVVQGLPTVWPPDLPNGAFPFVPKTIETAAVDPAGRLWISLKDPFTYVYDTAGDKIRTVQFTATGPLTATSFFFASATRLLVTPGCYEFAVR